MLPAIIKLFVVYSRRDLNAVRELRQTLRDTDCLLWIDVDELMSDRGWEAQLADELTRSTAMLLIHSWEWIYDSRFVSTDLRVVLEVARSLSVCPPTVVLRLDEAPSNPALRTLNWVVTRMPPQMPDLSLALRAACGRAHEAAQALEAIASTVKAHDDAARRLRVHLRQQWSHSLDLRDEGRPIELIDLWRPFFPTPTFRPDHPMWADDPATRCAIHSVKSVLFQAFAFLGQPEDFPTNVPLAYAALSEVVTAEPFGPAVDDPLSELNSQAATTQNLNYRDTLRQAQHWSRVWSPEVLTMFDIPEAESTTLFAAVARRLAELEAITPDED